MRLKVRHLRTELAWWSYAAGTDIVGERDVVDRLYQLYLLVMVCGSAASAWSMLLGRVSSWATALGSPAAFGASALMLMLPLLSLALSGVTALASPPLRLSDADAAYIASGLFDARSLAWMEVLPSALEVTVVTSAFAYLLQVAVAAAGGSLEAASAFFVCGFWCTAFWVLARSLGFIRPASDPRRRLLRPAVCLLMGACCFAPVLLAVASLGSIEVFSAASILFSSVPAWVASLLAVCVACLLTCDLAAHGFDLARAVEESGAYASFYEVRRMAFIAPGTYRDLRRRYRVSHRRIRPRIAFGEGGLALFAHALQVHVRQPECFPRLVCIGLLVVPFASVSLTGPVFPLTVVSSCLMLFMSSSAARELSLVFREDQRVRLLRDALPFSTLELALIDCAPAWGLTVLMGLAVQLSVSVFLPGFIGLLAFPVSVLLVTDVTLAATMDAIEVPGSRSRPSTVWWMLGLAVVSGLLALYGPAGVLCGLIAMGCLMLWKLSRGV